MLLQKTSVAVAQSGELVLLEIGARRWSLEFQPALELAAAMRIEAKHAKRAAGDDSFKNTVFGVLTDAAAPVPALSRFRRGLPERLAARALGVRAVGSNVEVSFGRDCATFGYRDAVKVAQWLRVRAKQARNAAGERLHWAQLADGLALTRT